MLTDTHAHLFWESYEDDLEKVIERARKVGVEKIMVPGVNYETSKLAVEIAEKYPEIIKAAVGIHPEDCQKAVSKDISQIEKLIRDKGEEVVAVGEVGIDLYTEEMKNTVKEQTELFGQMVEIANRNNKPLIIHTRESFAQVLQVLDELDKQRLGVFHCFSGNEEEMREVVKRGYMVSFAGNLTWSKRVRGLAEQAPADKLLTETDSPLMVPRDSEGQPLIKSLRNEPSSVRILAQLQAKLRDQSYEDFVSMTGDNAKRLFGL